MDIIDRIEATMAELREHPDRIINNAYLLYALHDLPGVSGTSAETAQSLCEGIAHRCLELLCPPLAVHLVGTEVCLLVHISPERSMEEVAQAAGQVWVSQAGAPAAWSGDYSAVSVSPDDAEELADAISKGDLRILAQFNDVFEEAD